jgi:hypothetical protein
VTKILKKKIGYYLATPGLQLAMAEPIQLSVPLPRSLDSRIYIHLTARSKYIMLFLTTASAEEVGTATPLGSFIYALPDVNFLRSDYIVELC